MNKIRNLISALLGPVALVALAVGLVWLLGSRTALPSQQQVSPVQTPPPILTEMPTPTMGVEPTTPTKELPTPTPRVTETPRPIPTPEPTPVVTPIPLAKPPFIPDLEGAVPQPFHLVLREDNEVWMMNSDGSDRRPLIDTEDKASLYLGHYPVQGIEGPPLRWGNVSPDGTKLALVVTDLWEPEYQGQPFKWDIYVLDIQTGELRFLVEGREPVWSPDGTRIAYVWGGGLWTVDAKSGEGKELFLTKEDYWVRDVSWSPDGRRIVFVHEVAPHGDMPELLVIEADEDQEPVPLKVPGLWVPGNLTWAPDGRAILFTFGTREPTAQWFYNLWMLDIESGGLTQLTNDINVVSFAFSPLSEDWIVLTGQLLYEEEHPSCDLWLMSIKGNGVLRLTHDSLDDRDTQWSPDGAQTIFRQQDKGIWTLNLVDGSLSEVYPTSADFAVTK